MAEPSRVLVVNCGSSSVKFAVVDPLREAELARGLAERVGTDSANLRIERGTDARSVELGRADHAEAMAAIVAELERGGNLAAVRAVGHRVVHGGETFRAPVRIDDAVLERVEALTPLAPLHNPLNLIGISAARGVLPQLPQVAVFDTAFHQTMAPDAFLYAIPRYLYDAHGIRRYGFHGTSHEWVSLEAGRRLGGGSLGLVTAHLGNGCSATAVWDGASVDTTMGLTPLEGLVMGTRSGDVDPGALPRIGEIASRDLAGVVELLNRESGLLGLSGLSNDMRVLLDRRREGDNDAKVAIDVFCHRLARAIGGLAAALPRFDGLVFTGGIGEHAWEIRRDVLTRLRSFGFELDPVANERHGRDTGGIITTSTSRAALVIATREELMIARHAWAVVTDGGELDG